MIIPVYNRENLIQRSIYSVLNQTYKNIEVLLVNDASTDNTEEMINEIKDDRLKYFKNEINLGPSKSRNIAIKLSAGELIAFQDSDDEWYKDKLEKQVKLLLSSPEDVAAVYCGMELIDHISGKFIRERKWDVNFRENFQKGPFILSPSN
ncbi:MAG TPA: glycosyltransferase family 2 protein, partial [Ignavibacteriaceae bacterium]|nr:glycosyltransferase family 2 protein [Ignavibacteriaceae bacterium]